MGGLRYTDEETMGIVQQVLPGRSTRIWSRCSRAAASACAAWTAT